MREASWWISGSSWKWARAVRTPQRSSEVSMEETSLLVDALAGFYVVEVVEEAVVVVELVGVEVEGAANLFEELGAGEIFALVGDAEGGEAEAGGGDGGHAARVDFAGCVVGGGAVEDLAGGGAGLLDEEEAGTAFHVVEEGFVGGGEGVVRVGLGCEGIGGSPCLRIETWGTRSCGERVAREERSAGEELEAIAPLHGVIFQSAQRRGRVRVP